MCSMYAENWVPDMYRQICLKIKKHVSLNISASSDRIRMQRSSLEPSRRDESNEMRFIFLRPLDAEIFNKLRKQFSSRRKMKRISFDSSRRDGSNELRCILIRSLDAEIFNKTCFFNFKTNLLIHI